MAFEITIPYLDRYFLIAFIIWPLSFLPTPISTWIMFSAVLLIVIKNSPIIIAPWIPYLDQATNTGGIAAIIMPIYGMNSRKNVNNP